MQESAPCMTPVVNLMIISFFIFVISLLLKTLTFWGFIIFIFSYKGSEQGYRDDNSFHSINRQSSVVSNYTAFSKPTLSPQVI